MEISLTTRPWLIEERDHILPLKENNKNGQFDVGFIKKKNFSMNIQHDNDFILQLLETNANTNLCRHSLHARARPHFLPKNETHQILQMAQHVTKTYLFIIILKSKAMLENNKYHRVENFLRKKKN